ncbi:MAG: B12-binding domain-containing radical SAM protein [Deltaproteobacteria bacterium]|nr:B12-binding domain-containing radical SAM protein [Deltaproteobacteria bacterium]
MRVLLVRTSLPRGGRDDFDYPPVAQPLGIMHLAASLRQRRPGDEVMVLDAAVSLETAGDLVKVLDDFSPQLVGLSALGYEEPLLAELASIARRWNPEMPVVVGGPLATGDPARVLAHGDVDVVVIGEGEITFPELVTSIAGAAPLTDVKGIALRDSSGKARLTARRPFIPDLNALPPVDWDDVELDRYEHLNNINDLPPHGRLALILTSRGCPYRCTYCHCFHGRKVRAWNRQRLGDEIERLVRRHGVGEIHIGDDIFNSRPGRIEDLEAEVASRGLDVHIAFPNGLRGDRLTRKAVRQLARAGCYTFCLAVETTSKRIQAMIRKKLDVARVLAAAEHAQEEGIVPQAFIMLGFPTETAEEMRQTVKTVSASRFDILRVFPVIPYPGTDLFEEAVRQGFDASKLDRMFMEDATLVNASPLSDDAFLEIVRWARTSFYEDPARVQRLTSFHASLGMRDHPLFRRGHWRQVLGR